MKFKNEHDVNMAIAKCPITAGGRRQYPVLFKKALIEYMVKTNQNTTQLAIAHDLNNSSVHRWNVQYQEGLLQIDAAYSVSPKSKAANASILAELQQQRDNLDAQIAAIEAVEALGFKVVQ